jgi:hypothetical protein
MVESNAEAMALAVDNLGDLLRPHAGADVRE